MTKARVLSAAAVAALLAHASPVAAGVKLVGSVVNATRGRAVPHNLRVEAAPVAADGSRGDVVAGRVDRHGRFEIGPLEESEHYTVATRYRGVIYTTTFEAGGADARGLRLAIFETTTSATDVRLNAITTIVDAGEDGTLRALEVVRVRNAGDRTYVGRAHGEPAVVELPVPEGAAELRAEEGTPALTQAAGNYFSRVPVQPGETRISYSYTLRPSDDRWALVRSPAYPARRADLLAGPGVHVAPGTELELLGTLDFKGTEYRQYRARAVGAHQRVETLLVAAAGGDSTNVPLALVVVVTVVCIATAVGTRAGRNRRNRLLGVDVHVKREVP